MNIKSVPKKQLWGIELNLVSLLFSSISPVLNKFSLTSLSPVVGGIFTSAFAAIFTFATILITRQHISLINLKRLWLWLLGGTNVNPLPSHYFCPTCKKVEFVPDERCGMDLPEKKQV